MDFSWEWEAEWGRAGRGRAAFWLGAGMRRRCAPIRAARVTRNRCPQSSIARRASGIRRCMMRALTSGTSGSSVAGHDQRWLPECAEPRQAGPAARRGELQVIAAAAREADVIEAWLRPGRDRAETRRHRCRRRRDARAPCRVTPRRQHLQQHRRVCRAASARLVPSLRAQPAAARAMLQRELLCDRASPRHAEHVGFMRTQTIEQRRGEARDSRRAVREPGSVSRPRRGRRRSRRSAPSSASMNGSASSMLAPSPLKNSRGGRSRVTGHGLHTAMR